MLEITIKNKAREIKDLAKMIAGRYQFVSDYMELIKTTENFKIYDVMDYAYYNDLDSYIDGFVELQWKEFEEDILNDSMLELVQLGSTSKHLMLGFLTKELWDLEDYFSDNDYGKALLYQEMFYGTNQLGVNAVYDDIENKDFTIDEIMGSFNPSYMTFTETERAENTIKGLDGVIEFYNDMIEDASSNKDAYMEEVEGIIRARDYMDDFKENQVEYFQEYLSFFQ